MSALTEADLAYAAALIDSFARLSVRDLPNGTQLPEVVIQGRIEALDWLAGVTGTSVAVIPKAYNRHQCSEHCPEAHTRIESQTRRWVVSGARATIVLAAVERFMRVQGRLARHLAEAGQRIGYKRTVVDEMRGLGWPIPQLRAAAWARVEVPA